MWYRDGISCGVGQGSAPLSGSSVATWLAERVLRGLGSTANAVGQVLNEHERSDRLSDVSAILLHV